MADYTSDRTGASIDIVLDNADAGNIGKDNVGVSVLNDTVKSGMYYYDSADANKPDPFKGTVIVSSISTSANATRVTQIAHTRNSRVFTRIKYGASWVAWQEVYSTVNTGSLVFSNGALAAGVEAVQIELNTGVVNSFRNDVTNATHFRMYNNNGEVGSIKSTGTATTFNTSSDPRLKDFKEAPIDSAIDTEFDKLFSCFRTFNWKTDPTGDLVWGFDAHACIDAKLDLGSEGKGSRDLKLGDVYKTDKAEVDEDGVETKAAVEYKVSPAGVDQSKAVPILLAKIEQLERRLKALEV